MVLVIFQAGGCWRLVDWVVGAGDWMSWGNMVVGDMQCVRLEIC